MTMTSIAPPEATSVAPRERVDAPASPERFVYTLERYHKAIATGVLTENDRVELIFGQVVNKMSIGKRHAGCVAQVNRYFTKKLSDNFLCWPQNPITIPDHSEPEPDFAIVNNETYQARAANPEPPDVLLLIEVADSSLEVDRGDKAKLYALAGIAEYWIINLRENQVEVYTQPNPTSAVYNHIQRFPAGATFESPFNGTTLVNDLLPA